MNGAISPLVYSSVARSISETISPSGWKPYLLADMVLDPRFSQELLTVLGIRSSGSGP